jgi:hypothetical protein
MQCLACSLVDRHLVNSHQPRGTCQRETCCRKDSGPWNRGQQRLAHLYPDNRAFAATQNGLVHVWDVDGLQTGAGTGSEAREIQIPKVGANITRIAHMKHR